jgi:hypothetical protein
MVARPMKMKIDEQEAEAIVWSPADSVWRTICSRCCGPLPKVPLILKREDGRTAQLCDPCANRCVMLAFDDDRLAG